MKLKSILLISILLMGCSTYREVLDQEPKPQVIEKEEVIENEVIKEVEKIVYVDRNITQIVNTTCPECNYTGKREIELIRRIRFLEGQTDKFINHSDSFDELNKTKIRLEECKHELCYEWNSSWCE